MIVLSWSEHRLLWNEGETTETQNDNEKQPKLKKSIIDCDIHHAMLLDDIKPYLPRIYREQIDMYGPRLPERMLYLNGGVRGAMVDATPPADALGSAAVPGGDFDYMCKHYLDPYHVEYGILSGYSYGAHTIPDVDYAAALCCAYNEYTIEHWLSKGDRLRSSIFIPKQDPALSAKEIHRVAGDPRFVQVIVSSGAHVPYGNRYYYPIYEACVQHNLPFTIHVSMEGMGVNPPPTGAGYVSYYGEYRACRPQVMMAHLASLIYEGVFERFPSLKVVLQEAGVFWVVPFLWRLDQDWKALRAQTPWVKKKPSEYFRSNIRVSTQPIEETPDRAVFDQMMENVYAKDTLMFSSDYPHWDFDSPQQSIPRLDDGLWERIFYQNAAELYNLPPRRAGKEKAEG